MRSKAKTGKTTRLGPRLRTYAGESIDRPLLTVTVSMADVMALVDIPPRLALTEGSPLMEAWQDARGQPKELGEVWALTKDTHTANCVLRGHAFGTEAIVMVDDDLMSSKVFRDPKQLVDETAAWRVAYEDKGWRAGDDDQQG